MGFLSKLFGKSPAKPSSGSGGLSFYALVMKTGGTVATKRCDIDGRTFPCPSRPVQMFGINTEEWVLDVGGYCPNCRGYRCEEHAKFGDEARIVCARCGTALTGGP